ncbi:FAD-dependent oxidoreductase, partial [Streptomyces sp. NPDC001665]
ENAEGPVRSAALPLGFNRHPLYTRGLLLVGDSGFQPVLNRYVMGSPALLNTLARLLTNLTEHPSRDAIDHVLNTAVRLVPAPGTSARPRASRAVAVPRRARPR